MVCFCKISVIFEQAVESLTIKTPDRFVEAIFCCFSVVLHSEKDASLPIRLSVIHFCFGSLRLR